eukprot:scaffold342324_cov43-Attheya_sp.AAC.1
MESGTSVSVNSARKKNTNVASSGNDEDHVRDKKAAITVKEQSNTVIKDMERDLQSDLIYLVLY